MIKNIQKFEKGGLSGKPLEDKSNFLINKFYKILKNKTKIIGVGGIDSGKSAYEKIINGGDVVICDFCNGGEETMGGVIVGSSAVCGDCTDRYGYDKEDYEYANEVSEIFDKERSFKDNVLE